MISIYLLYQTNSENSVMAGNPRRIAIVRHGERVDHRFQDAWVYQCFDSDGNYVRQDLNQPKSLPNRERSPTSYLRDSPLTAVGCLQAKLRGHSLASEGLLKENFEVFVSPSLRCVKTASNVLKGMNCKYKRMKVEACLFEWTKIQWYLNGNMPKWMTPEEFTEAGFNVDTNYTPHPSGRDILEGESVENFYARSHQLILDLLESTDNKDLLIVAHGFSLEALSRQLLGFPPRNSQAMLSVVRNIPYCGVIFLEQDCDTCNWKLLPSSARQQMTHASAHAFDACKEFCGSSNQIQ